MITYTTCRIAELPPAEIDAIKPLQQPYLKSSPNPQDLYDPENRNLLAITASQDNKPVALLLTYLPLGKNIGEIVSVYVTHEYRRRQIGSHLVELLKEYAKKHELKQIGIVYPSSIPDSPCIEGFLNKNNFSGKRFMLAEFIFDSLKFHPPWFLRNYQMPKDFEVFPWYQLSYEEAQSLKEKYSKNIIPFDVYPLARPGIFEPLNSLGLRYKGEVIGWMVNSRTASDIINYNTLYIDYDFQSIGYAIYLLVDSLNIHKQTQIKWGIFKVSIPYSSGKWLRFIRHRLAPYANEICEYHSKILIIN